MIDYFQAFCLAVLQGLTEFLPISSHGHLVLVPHLTGWHDHGLGFEVAVHVGTLLAVLIYFHADARLLLRDWARTCIGKPATPHSRLAWTIFIATVLTGSAALFFEDTISHLLRTPVTVAVATLTFGIALGLADKFGAKHHALSEIKLPHGIVLGIAQALALIPGTSRSGITITAGLLLGLTREAAARISFLMAIPIIILAGAWQTRTLVTSGTAVDWGVLIFATAVSAVVALACIHYLLAFLRRYSLLPFVIYRIALGVILLAVFL